jgi:hypothetical protein
MLNATLTFIEDPGHGWLQVPLTELDQLGIRSEITPYSYKNGRFAYLEEDCDMGVYLDARQAQGFPPPEFNRTYTHRFTGRDRYDRFS